jgi:hypothetical protein
MAGMGRQRTLITAADFDALVPAPTILRALFGSKCATGLKEEVNAITCTDEEEANHQAPAATKV